MAGNSFDQIAQSLLKQQQIMEQLQKENRELRQQLTDLREGRGIFIEINGQRFALKVATPENTPIEEPVSATPNTLTADQSKSPQSEKEKVLVSSVQEEKKASVTVSLKEEPTFLEEVMIDAFATALTTPISALTTPAKKPEPSEEEKNAILRRELMGSFLLE
jgi:hypothetical protein